MSKTVKARAIIDKGLDGWYVGKLVEFPGVLTQGRTPEETLDNLKDALREYLKTEPNSGKE